MRKSILAMTVGAMALAGSAHASIVTFNTAVPVPQNIDGVYINFATGATSTTEPAGFDFNPYAGASGTLLFYWGGGGAPNAGVASGTTYLDLAPGAVVSSASNFIQNANGVANETAAFLTPGIHTLGFKFLNEGTGTTNYGYARIQTGGNAGFPATVLGWSFENTGGAITVAAVGGAVPEPATWAMMIGGFGAVGASLRRRRSDAKLRVA